MERSAVADTGPLIAMAKVDQLELLHIVVGDILISPQVERELLVRRSHETERIVRAISTWLLPDTPDQPDAVQLRAAASLDSGEAQALWLAHQRRLPLVVDEARGRAAARSLSIPVIGTAGVLLEAKRQGLLRSVMPVLMDMRHHGYWLAESLMRKAAALAGESFTA